MKKTDEKQDNQRQKDGQSGQSLVEMAIMLVVLITLLAGVLDLGRAYYVYLSLQDAAGEGATYGSIFPDRLGPHDPAVPSDEDPCQENLENECDNPNNVVYRVQNEAPAGGLVDWSNTNVTATVPDPGNPEAGDPITVVVTYEYEVITPVIEVFTGDTMTLRATAVNTIVGQSN